jgi:hypothetical protein
MCAKPTPPLLTDRIRMAMGIEPPFHEEIAAEFARVTISDYPDRCARSACELARSIEYRIITRPPCPLSPATCAATERGSGLMIRASDWGRLVDVLAVFQ